MDVRDRGYAWSDKLTARFDSNWIRSALFATLNRVCPSELGGMERCYARYPITHAFFAAERDRVSVANRCYLALTEQNVLRYCPACLAKGYHSYLQQLKFLQRCPMHDEALVDGCSNCGRPRMWHNTCGSSRAYRCRYCQAPLVRERPKDWIRSAEFLEREQAAFGELAAWAQATRLISYRYVLVSDYRGQRCSREPGDELGTMLMVAPGVLPTGVRGVQASVIPSDLIVRVVPLPDANEADARVPQKEWQAIFRSVRRHLTREASECWRKGKCCWHTASADCGGNPFNKERCPRWAGLETWLNVWDFGWPGCHGNPLCEKEGIAAPLLAGWTHDLMGHFNDYVVCRHQDNRGRLYIEPSFRRVHTLEVRDARTNRRHLILAYRKFSGLF